MTDHKREVDKLRREISQIDEQLLAAIEKRARTARTIGELTHGEAASLPLRDRSFVEGLIERSKGELPVETLRSIFYEIQAACIGLEMSVRVAVLGPEGGIGHTAAREQFGPAVATVMCGSAAEALDAVARQKADFAVLPYETSVDGPVQATIAALSTHDLRIGMVREVVLDESHGRVRYAVIGARPSPPTGDDCTAVVFSLHDAPGALLDVLRQFAEHGLNLTRIQSRPAEGDGWAYLFFVEVLGHATDRQNVSAFEGVKRLTKFFKVLGSYPAKG